MNKNNPKNKVIAIVGATASGKTAYAVELAKSIDAEIVSADSRYVYKGFDIGTAKPTLEERQGIPHYMIDIVEPDFEYSSGLFVTQATECINDILSMGKTPIVTGGTGLYFNMLFQSYQLPNIEPDKKLREELSNYEFDELFEMLIKLDKTAIDAKIEKNDKKKLIRAIEIVKKTGLPLSASRAKGDCEYNVEWIGLNYEREELYERINKRVDWMVEAGLIEETKKLLDKYGRIPNLIDTIGYREIIKYFDGEMTFDEAIEKLKQNSRNYAKRQLTWFRKNEDIKWNIYPERRKK